jgi:hypothetical protein
MLHDETPEVRLAAIGTAIPPYRANQHQAEEFFLRTFASRLKRRSLQRLQQFLAHPSIQERSFAIDHPDCLLKETLISGSSGLPAGPWIFLPEPAGKPWNAPDSTPGRSRLW